MGGELSEGWLSVEEARGGTYIHRVTEYMGHISYMPVYMHQLDVIDAKYPAFMQ